MTQRTKLTEESVARAALELIDADGPDGLSIRKLAAALGVSPMTIYTYSADRDALLNAATQLIYAEIEAPAGTQSQPRETLAAIMASARRVLLRHPRAVGLVTQYPPRTLNALAFVEAGYRALRREGFSLGDTARAYRTLAAYSLGTAMVEINKYFALHPGAEAFLPQAETLQRHLPNVVEVAPLLAGLDDEAEFAFGLELALDGIFNRRSA
jgi:AcrR family transcriptional regulator